jgi:hypothetical protein
MGSDCDESTFGSFWVENIIIQGSIGELNDPQSERRFAISRGTGNIEDLLLGSVSYKFSRKIKKTILVIE